MYTKDINRRLKGHIVMHDGTQGALAEAMGISRAALSTKLNGKIRFSESEKKFIEDRYGEKFF